MEITKMADQAESIFTETKPVDQQAQQVVQPKPEVSIPDPVKDFVGEGKKYQDVSAALMSIPHAQLHIQKLEAELEELRNATKAADANKDILSEIQKVSTPKPVQVQQGQPVNVEEIVNKVMTEKERMRMQSANTKTVVDTMVEAYGDTQKANQMYVTKATELGMSIADLNALVSINPKAALKLLDVPTKSKTEPKITSSISTEGNINLGQQQPKPKSIMYGASHKDLLAAWQATAPKE